MKTILWDNKYLQIQRIDGTISSVKPHSKEPAISYYLQVGRHRRGTMYGNPSFFDTRDTFHGAVHYEHIFLTSGRGGVVSLHNVDVIRKFQNFFTQGRQCSIYLLSPKGKTTGHHQVFAVRTPHEHKHDLGGICSMADNLLTGLNRQLRLIGIPVGLSLLMGALVLKPFFGILPMLLLIAFLGVSYPAGQAIIKNRLGRFPSCHIFANVLRKDGWELL